MTFPDRSGHVLIAAAAWHDEHPGGANKLLGLGDFLAMLPDLSERRAWLQEHRRRSDAAIVERFGGHWTSAVPSSRLDLHLDLRNALLGVLRVEP